MVIDLSLWMMEDIQQQVVSSQEYHILHIVIVLRSHQKNMTLISGNNFPHVLWDEGIMMEGPFLEGAN